MKKYLVALFIAITYLVSTGGCMAANAMPVQISYFVITNDIGSHIKNLTPPEGTAMPASNFVFEFDVVPLESGGYIPIPEIESAIGVLQVTSTPLVGSEGNHVTITITGLTPGQKVTVDVDDK